MIIADIQRLIDLIDQAKPELSASTFISSFTACRGWLAKLIPGLTGIQVDFLIRVIHTHPLSAGEHQS